MLQMANKTLVEFNRTRTCMHVETNILITSSFHFALNTKNYPIPGNVNFIFQLWKGNMKSTKHSFITADFFRCMKSDFFSSTRFYTLYFNGSHAMHGRNSLFQFPFFTST